MSPLVTLIWLLNMMTDVVGQLSFKAAAVRAGDAEGLARWQVMLTGKWIWLGIFAYVLEVVLWLALLSMVPLSVGVLLGSFNIICVMIGGRVCFGEKITRHRAAAVALITLGVALVGWGQ